MKSLTTTSKEGYGYIRIPEDQSAKFKQITQPTVGVHPSQLDRYAHISATGHVDKFTQVVLTGKDKDETIFMVVNNGQLYVAGKGCWRFGITTNQQQNQHILMPVPNFDHVTKVSCTEFDSAAIIQDGKLYISGNVKYGQASLVDGAVIIDFTEVQGYNNVTDAIITLTSLVFVNNGQLYVCGKPLGMEVNSGDDEIIVPMCIPGFDKVTLLAVSDKNMAVVNNGQLYTCGNNEKGQLGLGFISDYVPNLTVVPDMTNVSIVSLTDLETIILVKDEQLYFAGRLMSTNTFKLHPRFSDITLVKSYKVYILLVDKGQLYKYFSGISRDFELVDGIDNVLDAAISYHLLAVVSSSF